MLDFDMFGPVWQERSASGEVGASNVGLTIGSLRPVKKIRFDRC